MSRLICALDMTDVGRAAHLAGRLTASVALVKLGKEFFVANGPEGVRRVAGAHGVFLDLKFHDIPHTVAGAVAAAVALRPVMLTVHACGGLAMMRAAVAAAHDAAASLGVSPPLILGVTVLTSLNAADLSALGIPEDPGERALRLADLAQKAGCHGVVCSPVELVPIRRQSGPDFVLVAPGVRPIGAGRDDQKRTATPSRAIAAGADYIVVGRPITGASDPVGAAAAMMAEMTRAGSVPPEPGDRSP